MSAGVFNLTRERDFGQQQMEPWQFSSSVDDGSCSESGKAEFDMDLDNYPMPMFAEQLGNLINPVDMTDDMMALEILGDSDNLSSEWRSLNLANGRSSDHDEPCSGRDDKLGANRGTSRF